MQGLRQLQQTVELVIDDGCICNKSAAKSLLQVEMRLRPGSAGLADRTLFFEPPAASARTVPEVATGRQSMTRRWQFYDYLNTRIGCGAEDRKGYILPTVKTTARGITMS